MKQKECGVEKTARIVGQKWTLLIIRDLCEGTKRFGELQRALFGISPKTLALRLNQLEKESIVKRRIFKEVPLHVEYTLTSKGESLKEIIEKMREWGEKSA